MTHWLPDIQEFRSILRTTMEKSDDAAKLNALEKLALHNLTYLQTIQLEQALRQLGAVEVDGFSKSRIAILSSATVNHLMPAIRIASLRRKILADVYVCPYAQYRQELLDSGSALHEFRPHFVLFALTARDVMSCIPIASTADESEQAIAQYVNDLVSLWSIAHRSLSATVIQQTFLNTGDSICGSFDRLFPGAPTRLVRRLNDQLVQAASENDILILDIERSAEKDGLYYWFDTTRWLQGKIEISPEAAPLYGDLVARIVAAHYGLSKKCLVLDLDNTLWGGVVGDDGIEQIVLGEGSALGEAFLAFQRYVRQLGERGVILAVCSKNDLDTAESVFFEHPDMQLKRSDFAAFFANWDDKAANLQNIADQLNINIDSLVFVDDNPAERARIRQSLPQVAVPELPEDPAHFVRCLSDAGYFETISITPDDMQRNKQYVANTSRKALQTSTQSLEDYLISLEMWASAGPFADVDLHRITQLINKTNQFNTTTRRRSLDEVRALAAEPSNMTLQIRLSDRFGDSGLVSAMILRPDPETSGVLDIDTWLMSCRVFGRGLEFEAVNILAAMAKARNTEFITAAYFPTPSNRLIRDLYARLGFEPVSAYRSDRPGETRWRLELNNFSAHETHIAAGPT